MRRLFFLATPALFACSPAIQPEGDVPPEAPTESVAAAAPLANARTVEQFDTTTEAQRTAATASSGGEKIGETVATLGDAATPGFWVETTLVDTVTSGRVVNTANDKSVDVELRPMELGSSRVSLATLRLLEAPLTELVTLEVFRR